MFYTATKVSQLYSLPHASGPTVDELAAQVAAGQLPMWRKGRGGFGWDDTSICDVGTILSPMRRPSKPLVFTVFVTKGGVLKTTLSLNLARLLALNGLKTLVVGLDLQGDITTNLGHQISVESDNLDQALKELDTAHGLYDYFNHRVGLENLIQATDLACLHLIPETPELMALDQELLLKPRREYWLKEKVTGPLSQKYDVIILDCSPSWNQLITNALVAADVLISPVECRINNYRNLKMFQPLLAQFRRDLNLDFQHVYVPTRLNSQRKLSREIGQWYAQHLPGCLDGAIRESVHGEEASALNLSVPEHAADSASASEIKSLLHQIWLLATSGRKSTRALHQENHAWPSV